MEWILPEETKGLSTLTPLSFLPLNGQGSPMATTTVNQGQGIPLTERKVLVPEKQAEPGHTRHISLP